MTVFFKKFVITDIILMQKAEVKALGMSFAKNPNLDVYRIVAISKSYIDKTGKGREILKKLGHGEKMDELDIKYMDYQDAFTVMLPITSKSLNWNKYQIGDEIMVSYYPTNVWATFHCENEKDNDADYKRYKEEK